MRCPFCDSTNVEETAHDEDRLECLDCEEFFYIDDIIDDDGEDTETEHYLEDD